MIANIIPEKRTFDKETYSYKIPAEIGNNIKVGSICHIPFGKKKIRGVIESITNTSKSDFQLKEIIDVSPVMLPREYLDIARWIESYYLCSLGEAVSLFIPPDIKRLKEEKSERKNIDLDFFLTSEQKLAYQGLRRKMANPKKPALLFGVTGSGKTEMYIKLVADCLKAGKQAVVLVPEIMLTAQTIERFEKSFPGQTCLFHSQLIESEKYRAYFQFYSGAKNIIIGPRSALLVPPKNLGLIIIDEEQEDAYKQEKAPRYHAVTLAEKIAKKNNAYLLLGTATPRIETYYKAKNGKYDLFTLSNRFHKLILPPAEIIDLKEEIKQNNFSPISGKLKAAIEKVLSNKKQAILFLNRRGMSTFVSCRDCGYVENCPKCDLPLVYHLNEKSSLLSCHHCNYSKPLRTSCPKCRSVKFKFFGIGIEKIEREINKLFPKASVARFDSQKVQNKNDLLKMHNDIKNKKIDILIGTQILAKGLDVENIDLVGIISADVGMHMPYFRAMEKTFQIVTQVSGRSGRKHNAGRTIIQTYWPGSKAIKLAAEHNYQKFYENEILDRKEMDYPPFCVLIRVVTENTGDSKAKSEIEKIATVLQKNGINIIGPGKCFYSRLHNRFRYHLVIKNKFWPDKKVVSIFKSNPYLTWDVEPTDLL